MIGAAKAFLKRHWPALRLRTILFGVLLFAAAMPAASGVFLRVYENTLVRQTEAELRAQGAAFAAAASVLWPGAPPPDPNPDRRAPGYYQPEAATIDLSSTPILPERPAAGPARPLDVAARDAAGGLGPVIDRTTRTTLASVLVLDRTGQVVRGPGVDSGDLSALPEVREALAGRASTVLRRRGQYQPRYSFEWLSRASAVRLHHARPIRVGDQVVGVLLLSRSPRALFRGIYEERVKIALGAAGILLALVVLAGLVSRGVTRPIERLSAASREAAEGRGALPVTPPTAAVEIRALYDAFRAMAEANVRRSRYLRDFAAAVSHEFKTPLAGIAGAVELLQDHLETMSPAERGRFLQNISEDTRRLSHLVTRLLDLARADMARPEADAAVDLRTPFRNVADALGGPPQLDLELPADLPAVAVPEATLEAVLTALVENSRQAGATRVAVTARRTPDAVIVSIADDGPGVPQADRERLFEPFFTSRRAEGGTGLGLPIARSLLAASHGRLALVESPTGARFELVLPLAPVA